jgi:hypothetical protein
MSNRKMDIGNCLSAEDLVAVLGARSSTGAAIAQQRQLDETVATARPGASPVVAQGRPLPSQAMMGTSSERDRPSGQAKPVAQLVRQQAAVQARSAPKVRVEPASKTRAPGVSIEELERLAKLRERGVITDAEFAAMKKQLLGG